VGGRVTIESSANQGTCVNVQVPNVNPPQDR
jgi:signal transduction histidine kinase